MVNYRQIIFVCVLSIIDISDTRVCVYVCVCVYILLKLNTWTLSISDNIIKSSLIVSLH